MKPKSLSGIGALFAALLIAGALFVTVVSATESNQEDTHPSGGYPVDRDAVLGRSPHLFDDAGNRLSDKEISQMIEKMPKVTYLDGMNESRSKELSEGFTRLHKYRSVRVGDSLEASPQSTSLQADSGIRINEHHYQGPATSTGKFQSSQPTIAGPSIDLLKACLNKQEPVTITLGGLPLSKGGKSASYSDLENFTDAMGDLIGEHYLYPNGSLIGFGYDIDGYLRASIWNGPLPPEDVSSIETLHAMLDERAKEMRIENITVKFTIFTSPPELVLNLKSSGAAAA